jgi:hypothetical protein
VTEGIDKVKIYCKDGIYILKQKSFTTELKTDEKVEDLFSDILTAVSWADGSSLGNDETV